MKHPIENNYGRIVGTTAIIAAILLISFALGSPTARADGRIGADSSGLAGSDVWFDTMRKLPANEALLLALAKTNFITGLPFDCVEVAGTITFPDGNPFAGDQLPELNISCRDRSVDAEVRVPRLDDAGHFYTVFKRGQTYEFYWKRGTNRDKFCTLQVSADAQPRQKLAIPCPAKAVPAVNPVDSPAELPRDRASLSREYDLSGFPPKPTSPETRKIADAIKFARSNPARAAAHEMLGRYYRDTKLDEARAASEFKKAEALRTMSAE
jgi:hypothetical protein